MVIVRQPRGIPPWGCLPARFYRRDVSWVPVAGKGKGYQVWRPAAVPGLQAGNVSESKARYVSERTGQWHARPPS